ncbi:hypothetical protein [Haloarcula litorea]|uniref:hypothetical protein n=1 Tax=Haloarcula litorea TaxID=3032579 RepID=UPI0023E829C8|nr:hypothetical protein [Halomicroarcula sp. GDY20]
MSDDEPGDDPFDEFDPADEREGDPFDALDAPGEESDDGQPATRDDRPGPADGGLFDGVADDADGTVPFPDDDAAETPGEDPVREGPVDPGDPFSGMEDREGDPFGGAESPFEQVDVGSVDADEVWESLGDDTDDRTVEFAGSRYAEVSKHRYCEQCEYFSGPPEVRCTHDGTEIVEFLDMETVRLLDCPLVAEQRALGNDE